MIPKSKVLSTNRSYSANARISYCSPEQTQSQSVVVNVGPGSQTEIKKDIENDPTCVQYNPYSELQLPTSIEEFKAILEQKDKQMTALSLIIEIIKSNPLIINKYIIPHNQYLNELIRLLTNATEVEFVEKELEGCSCNCDGVIYLEKIFVRKNNELHNLKYNYPDVIQVLESHKISYKIATV
jgi:hypothetical protein